MASEMADWPEPNESSARKPKVRYPHKTSFYQAKASADRMRAAFLNTGAHTGFNSLSDFINAAIEDKIAGLEQAHNEGRPWQPLGAGEIPRGKPVGRRPATDQETQTTMEGPQMPRVPAKELVELVEKVRRELEGKFRAGRGEVNVFYRDDGLQALVETYDLGTELSAVRCYEYHPGLREFDVRTSGGIEWEEGPSLPPSP